jgi:hypothetical protein
VTEEARTPLKALEPLVGERGIVAEFEGEPPAAGGRVVFEWMTGGRFLIERWEVPVPEVPDGIALIGADPDSEGTYLQHYFDSRGVARVYGMSFSDGVWKLWRGKPDLWRPCTFRGCRRGQTSGRSRSTSGIEGGCESKPSEPKAGKARSRFFSADPASNPRGCRSAAGCSALVAS